MQKWNEDQRKALRELILEDGKVHGKPLDKAVERQILAMVDEGLVTANPDGTITLTGTRDQLLAHGLDPDKMHEMDPEPRVDQALDANFVTCRDPKDPERLLCFPTEIYEQVIAGGEKGYVPLTAAEVREVHRQNPDGTVQVSMVLSYEKDKGLEALSPEELEQELAKVDEEILSIEEKQRVNKEDVEALEWLKTHYGQLLGTRDGQQFVGVNIIGLRARDKRPSSKIYDNPVMTKVFGDPRPDPTMPTRVVMDPPVGRGVVMSDAWSRWGVERP